MGANLKSQIKDNLVNKTTEELVSIWVENDRNNWSNDAFESIQELLKERGASIPEQKNIVANEQVKGSKGQMILYFIGAVFFAGWLILKWDSLGHEVVVFKFAPNFGLLGMRTFLGLFSGYCLYKGFSESQKF